VADVTAGRKALFHHVPQGEVVASLMNVYMAAVGVLNAVHTPDMSRDDEAFALRVLEHEVRAYEAIVGAIK
jgi:hypothetical protein